MQYEVILLPIAERGLQELQGADFSRIVAKISSLEMNPRPHGCMKLKGQAGQYRLRQGDYRILYRVDEVAKRVFVYKIGHRRDVYR